MHPDARGPLSCPLSRDGTALVHTCPVQVSRRWIERARPSPQRYDFWFGEHSFSIFFFFLSHYHRTERGKARSEKVKDLPMGNHSLGQGGGWKLTREGFFFKVRVCFVIIMMLMRVKSRRGGGGRRAKAQKKKWWVQGFVCVSGSCGGQVHICELGAPKTTIEMGLERISYPPNSRQAANLHDCTTGPRPVTHL